MPEFVRRQREVRSVFSRTEDRGVLIRELASVRRPINDVVHQAGNSGLAAVFIPELTPNETDVPKIVLSPQGRLNPAACLRPVFQFFVNAPVDGRFDLIGRNRYPLLRCEELRNSFSRSQYAPASKFVMAVGKVSVPRNAE